MCVYISRKREELPLIRIDITCLEYLELLSILTKDRMKLKLARKIKKCSFLKATEFWLVRKHGYYSFKIFSRF